MSYLSRLVAGHREIGRSGSGSVEHYWRWPVRPRWRWMLGVSWHGIRDGVMRGHGPFHPAVRSMLWIGPIGLEFGWHRQAIENWRWRRRLRSQESREEPHA